METPPPGFLRDGSLIRISVIYLISFHPLYYETAIPVVPYCIKPKLISHCSQKWEKLFPLLIQTRVGSAVSGRNHYKFLSATSIYCSDNAINIFFWMSKIVLKAIPIMISFWLDCHWIKMNHLTSSPSSNCNMCCISS